MKPISPLTVIFVSVLLFTSVLQAPAFGSAGNKEIRIGVLAKLGKQQCFAEWDKTAEYLEQNLFDYRVQIVCLDFDEMENAISEKWIDFIISNPAAYINLESKYGVSRMLTLVNNQSNRPATEFGGVIFYRSDRSDINSLDDLKSKKFIAVAENSFGGWLAARRYLVEHGIDPSKDFSELSFAGTHDLVLDSVLNGSADAGTVRTDTIERRAVYGSFKLADISFFQPDEPAPEFTHMRTTRLYPEWPIAKARHTSNDLAKKVSIALLAMPGNDIPAFFSKTKGWTIPLDYNEVRDTLRILRAPPFESFDEFILYHLYKEHKTGILGGAIVLTLLICIIVLFTNMNRKLKTALTDLYSEHRLRAATVTELNEFKQTLDQTMDSVFIFTKDRFQITYANRGASILVNHRSRDLLQMSFLTLMPELIGNQFCALVTPLAESARKSITFTSEIARNGGACTPVEIFLQHIKTPQTEERYVAIVRDISKRLKEQTEKELLQAKLLQEHKLASVGQLAAGVAHEINTPAQYIGSNIDFLGEACADVFGIFDNVEELFSEAGKDELNLPLRKKLETFKERADWSFLKKEIPAAIAQASQGVAQISSIITAMRNFAHPGGDNKELTNINGIIENTVAVCRNEWKYCADIILNLDPELPQVSCRPGEIGQVFLNLIVNAVHAIEELTDKSAAVEKGRITISSWQETDNAYFSVSDSGCGINKMDIDRLFEPFFTTKEVGKGSGQGLAISHDIIINKHGGEISVSSEKNTETTFTISLPFAIASERTQLEPA